MGEVVLRKIQAGVETVRGTAVPATRKVYGVMTVTRSQPTRFAAEDRGSFVDKWRGNKQLVEDGFSLAGDVLFEDEPFMVQTYAKGSLSSAGGAAGGYTWGPVVPDQTADTLTTVTWEAGDDTVAWQGPFGTTDTADYTLALADAVTCTRAGFISGWTPQSYATPGLPTSFAGFTGGVVDHAVESVMGYQSRLFYDPTGTPVGSTWVAGRFIAATWGYHNQNKRKYYGDGSARFTRLGRGRRQVHAQVTFEALDTTQYADWVNTSQRALRIGMYGTPVSGSSIGTTSGALSGTVTTVTLLAGLTNALPGGAGIYVGGTLFVVGPGGAAAAATSIPVVSQAVVGSIASGSTVQVAKTLMYDFWGVWDTFAIGNRDTNTTFQFDLQAVYDGTAAAEAKITIINQNSTV